MLGADVPALSKEAQAERDQGPGRTSTASVPKVLDLNFNALALGQEPPAYDSRCPFQGMSAFDYEQRAFFFGRETLIEPVAETAGQHNFLAVLGPSGSGKSSLVMAGLIPALEKQHPGLDWSVIKPGDDIPQSEIPNSQSEIPNPQSLLVVDQFEELFTLTADDAERQAFIDQLAGRWRERSSSSSPCGRTSGANAPSIPALKEEMQAHQELIPPMTPAELRSAMEQQAGSVELRFEADLANTILDDVAGEPGAMPLLQHALLELWKRRHGRWLRAEEYRNLGGVRQAIARTADAIYEQADARQSSSGCGTSSCASPAWMKMRRSALRSTGSPSRMMASPSSLNHCVVMCSSLSIKPTMATVGVGSIGPSGFWL